MQIIIYSYVVRESLPEKIIARKIASEFQVLLLNIILLFIKRKINGAMNHESNLSLLLLFFYWLYVNLICLLNWEIRSKNFNLNFGVFIGITFENKIKFRRYIKSTNKLTPFHPLKVSEWGKILYITPSPLELYMAPKFQVPTSSGLIWTLMSEYNIFLYNMLYVYKKY